MKLPGNCKNYIISIKNKSNLCSFLSRELAAKSIDAGYELVVSGGFLNPKDVVSTNKNRDLIQLKSDHEEADTRIILHATDAKQQGYNRIDVHCSDTDVLVLLVAQREHLPEETFMKTGTANKRKCIAVHKINLTKEIENSLIAFHAITGCDTTSQFCGISKARAWKVFVDNANMLSNFGKHMQASDDVLQSAESFVCKLYDKKSQSTSINEIRSSLFRKSCKEFEKLPPTQDALLMHLRRAQYQAYVWLNSRVPCPKLPTISDCGWKIENGKLLPIPMLQVCIF